MSTTIARIFCLALAGIFFCLPALSQSQSAQPQKKSKRAKPPEPKVEVYYGGIFLVGDGGIPNGPCFRINGHVTSAGFFNELKSYDSGDGTVFRLGTNEVTQFPEKVLLSLTIRDQPCSFGLQPVGTGVYLTPEAMGSLRLSIYWKHGVELRPAGKIAVVHYSVDPIEPYATQLAAELPKRYLWSYEFGIPAASVPLTDSLVLIFRTPDGRIAARVAARL
jgi:hypothetical protein